MGAQPYSTLYGEQATFTTDGQLRLCSVDVFQTVNHNPQGYPTNITLFLHRVSLSSQIPPTSGFYVANDADKL